ncbi:NAD-binding protein [Gordonia sp. CPCC 205515]|uniref:NAD-binding protein n=1 Tax=Gordonia sp. CPCC 205515 TaxID=3140791 RepID=UPI003AF3BD7F
MSAHGHLIVCGFSGIGVRIIEQLIASGERVVLVVRAMTPELDAALHSWDVELHVAIVNISDVLVDAGIDDAQAVLCVEDDELWNLETALSANRLRPDIRVVTQMANTTVRAELAEGGTPGATLDIADLAAPSVVEACLGHPEWRLTIENVPFVAAQVQVPRASTLRDLYGDLAPVAVASEHDRATASVVSCPGRDLAVRAGDVATMFGTPRQFADQRVDIGAAQPVPERPGRRPVHPLRTVHHAVSSFVQDVNPNFFRMITLLATLLLLSTLVLRFGYQRPGMSVLDAIYFSTETIATVGYGDFNFSLQPTWLRIWSIVLMFAGLTTTAMVMAFLAELLVSRRISQTMGRRRARFMSGHVVVIGLGAFGIRVAAEIRSRGHDVVIVEISTADRYLSAAQDLDIPIVFGDATLTETLRDAGVDRASAVAVLTSNDMVNVEVGLTARGVLGDRWNDTADQLGVPVVMRIFNRSLAHSVTARFGFRHVQSTAELAAPWFIGAALGLEVLVTMSVRSESFMVGRMTIHPGQGLDGVAMQELSANTRVVAIARADGHLEYPPRRGTSFAAGDRAYLLGPYEELLSLLEQQRGGAAA